MNIWDLIFSRQIKMHEVSYKTFQIISDFVDRYIPNSSDITQTHIHMATTFSLCNNPDTQFNWTLCFVGLHSDTHYRILSLYTFIFVWINKYLKK
jgi:hypothetical protein